MNKKTILIVGGHGFLGKNLNNVFQGFGFEIHNESRRTGCDILDLGALKQKISTLRPYCIINAAAHVGSIAYVTKNAANVCHDNTQMYLNIFKAIQETDPDIVLVNPISNCSYPGIIDVQHEELWWQGVVHESVESYGNPKKLGFILSECYRKQYGIRTVNLIMSNAYGPLDYADVQRTHAMNGIVIRMIRAIRNGDQEFVVWGSGTPVREWIYMEDAARIIREILEKEMFDLPQPLNIGQEYGVSINESVGFVRSMLKSDIKITNDLTKQDGAPIKVLGKKKFREHFPDFSFTGYEDGIAATIKYYESIL
ncbi:MAG: NAD-dependent epimerase/dehydratase family protein [Spartobacteria bacterium]